MPAQRRRTCSAAHLQALCVVALAAWLACSVPAAARSNDACARAADVELCSGARAADSPPDENPSQDRERDEERAPEPLDEMPYYDESEDVPPEDSDEIAYA